MTNRLCCGMAGEPWLKLVGIPVVNNAMDE
jgi:hypothetical protein